MKPAVWIPVLLGSILVIGCGAKHPPPAPTAPLTIEEWKELPVDTKYEIGTLERLKEGTPKLQDDREWHQFARTVLVPAKKRELPGK
jgi:hypothetical protein